MGFLKRVSLGNVISWKIFFSQTDIMSLQSPGKTNKAEQTKLHSQSSSINGSDNAKCLFSYHSVLRGQCNTIIIPLKFGK